MCMFKNRPLALAFLCFALISILSYGLSFWETVGVCGILLAAFSVVAILYAQLKRRGLFLSLLCLLLSALAALSSALLFHAPREKLAETVGEETLLEGHVVRCVLDDGERSTYDLQLENINGMPSQDTVRIKCKFSAALEIGERLHLTAMGVGLSSYEGYDESASAFSDGVFAAFSVEDEKAIDKGHGIFNSLSVFFARAGAFLSNRLQEAVGGEEGRLCAALLLGERSALSNSTVLAFQRCGISHLLALSGLHVSILIAFVTFVMSKFRMARWIRVICIVFLATGYLLLTGCAPSTVRAVLMVTILSVAFLSRGEYDSFTSLLCALFLILLFAPYSARDLGMWMSFLAAGSIIAFLPPLNAAWVSLRAKWSLPSWLIKCISGVVTAFMVGIVANLGLLLVQAYFFGEVSLLSVPATMLLSFALSVTLVLSIATCVFVPMGGVCRVGSAFMLWVSREMSSMHGILLPLDDPISLGLVLFISLLLIAVLLLRLRHVCRWLLGVMCLALLLAPVSVFVTQISEGDVKASYLSVSGTETVIISKGGTGNVYLLSNAAGTRTSRLLDKLDTLRCTEIEALVFPLYGDSYPTFLNALASNIRVQSIRLPLPTNDWEEYVCREIVQVAKSHDTDVYCGKDAVDVSGISAQEIVSLRKEDTRILFLSWNDGGKRVGFVNAAFLDSSHYTRNREKLIQCDAIFVGKDGFSSKASPKLRMQSLNAECVIFSDKKLMAIIRDNRNKIPCGFGEGEYTFD